MQPGFPGGSITLRAWGPKTNRCARRNLAPHALEVLCGQRIDVDLMRGAVDTACVGYAEELFLLAYGWHNERLRTATHRTSPRRARPPVPPGTRCVKSEAGLPATANDRRGEVARRDFPPYVAGRCPS